MWKRGKATRRTEAESSSGSSVILDDGMKVYDVFNTKGELICKIRFRPGDYSILRRSEEIKAELPMIFKPIRDANYGEGMDEEEYNALVRQVEAVVERRVIELFNAEGLSELFKVCSPLSFVGGKFFAEQVLNVLAEVVRKEIAATDAQRWDHIRGLTSHT